MLKNYYSTELSKASQVIMQNNYFDLKKLLLGETSDTTTLNLIL